MAKIIDFHKGLIMRKELSINKSEKGIDIETKKGKMHIELDIVAGDETNLQTSAETNSKENSAKVEKISEEECKEKIFVYLKLISVQNSIEERFENLWSEIRDEIINSQNFIFVVTAGNVLDTQSQYSSTFVVSSVFSVVKE